MIWLKYPHPCQNFPSFILSLPPLIYKSFAIFFFEDSVSDQKIE
jgi:hypothetical protein